MVGRGYVPMVARRSRRWKNGNKQRHACTATTTERFQLSSSPFRPTRLLLLCIFTYTYFTTLICCLPATPVSLYLCRLAFNLHTLEVCAVCTRNYSPTAPSRLRCRQAERERKPVQIYTIMCIYGFCFLVCDFIWPQTKRQHNFVYGARSTPNHPTDPWQ